MVEKKKIRKSKTKVKVGKKAINIQIQIDNSKNKKSKMTTRAPTEKQNNFNHPLFIPSPSSAPSTTQLTVYPTQQPNSLPISNSSQIQATSQNTNLPIPVAPYNPFDALVNERKKQEKSFA